MLYDETVHGFRVSRTKITTAHAAEALGRAVGEYVTLHTGRLRRLESPSCAGSCLAAYLRKYLRPHFGKNLLICGLGNQDLIEDSLGPLTVKKIPAHFMEFTEIPARFSSVGLLTPDVHGRTNIKTEITLSGVAKEMGADCIILIDSTQTDSLESLAGTIQITTGQMRINGSGHTFSRESLGIPIIGIGVPLVMRYAQGTGADSGDLLMRTGIADDLESAAFAIAYGISRIAYPKVGPSQLEQIMRAI